MTATSTDYITEQEFLDYIKSGSDTGNPIVGNAISAASRQVDAYCGRVFNNETAVTRYFSGTYTIVDIDDLADVSGLSVHTDTGSGTYPTALTINTDFIVEPVNQSFGGVPGWPYTRLRAKTALAFPLRITAWQPDTVKVTGTFGWPAVPDPVKRATSIIAAMFYELAKAPLGVAGWGAYGELRVRDIPQASTLLAPYRKGVSFGIA